MNDINYQTAVREAVKPRFRGKKRIVCRTIPRYPDTAEREFRRVNRRYMKLLNKTMKEHLPEITDAYKNATREDSRYDSIYDLKDRISRHILQMAAELDEALEKFGLLDEIERISRVTQAKTIKEWQRAVRYALGLDLFTDYYRGELYEQLIQAWIAESVNRIKRIPNDTLGKLQDIILEGYREGKHLKEIQKEIQETYNTSKQYAEMLARDQVSTLNAELTKMQQTDAGVKKYRWSSSHDSRVRDAHADFDGKIFSWDDPPEDWYMTKSRGIVYTGYKFHPGEAFGCRCVAIPIFEWETLNLPIKG